MSPSDIKVGELYYNSHFNYDKNEKAKSIYFCIETNFKSRNGIMIHKFLINGEIHEMSESFFLYFCEKLS